MALRPDLTAQVARLVATRLSDEPGPLRLYYQGSVVRLPVGGSAAELFQVGVELIDAPQTSGDLEAVLLAQAMLGAVGVSEVTLDLGHAEIVRAALDGLPPSLVTDLITALQKRDVARLAALGKTAKLPAQRRKLLEALPMLHGGVEVLKKARRVLGDGKSKATAALGELETLVAQLEKLGAASRIGVDLGEVRGFDYYTGTRFVVYAEGAGAEVASGGRYDRLIERYGRSARATGFALNVDELSALLRARGIEAPRPTGGALVAGDPVTAAWLAGIIRQRGLRAILDLEPSASDGERKVRAARHQLSRVIFVDRSGARWNDPQSATRTTRLAATAWRRALAGDVDALDALLPTR